MPPPTSLTLGRPMLATDEFRRTANGCPGRSNVTNRDRIGCQRRRSSRSSAEWSGLPVRGQVPAAVGGLAAAGRLAAAVGRLAADAEASPSYDERGTQQRP